jgi:hypothetical protein
MQNGAASLEHGKCRFFYTSRLKRVQTHTGRGFTGCVKKLYTVKVSCQGLPGKRVGNEDVYADYLIFSFPDRRRLPEYWSWFSPLQQLMFRIFALILLQIPQLFHLKQAQHSILDFCNTNGPADKIGGTRLKPPDS